MLSLKECGNLRVLHHLVEFRAIAYIYSRPTLSLQLDVEPKEKIESVL
jgi:hypothetical protein